MSKKSSEIKGKASVEAVMYNHHINRWERFLEPCGEGRHPAEVSFMIGQVDMTQVLDNMEEIPIATEGIHIILHSWPPFEDSIL